MSTKSSGPQRVNFCEKSKKWRSWACEHEECIAAAVARRILGPETAGLSGFAAALKELYDDAVQQTFSLQQNSFLNGIRKETHGYWAQTPIVSTQESQEARTRISARSGTKSDE